MSEWEPYPQEEHDAIVDNLRRQGWDRHDANEEADRLMAERIKRRKGGQNERCKST